MKGMHGLTWIALFILIVVALVIFGAMTVDLSKIPVLGDILALLKLA